MDVYDNIVIYDISFGIVLPELGPGQPFRIATSRRYHRNRTDAARGEPKLALQPRPQDIGRRQPGWLFGIDPPVEDDKDTIPR